MKTATGNAFACVRKERGYTQEKLAQESNVSVKTIQLWELIGTKSATVSKLLSVAEVLGVDLSEILC